jgi:hypothetical protein
MYRFRTSSIRETSTFHSGERQNLIVFRGLLLLELGYQIHRAAPDTTEALLVPENILTGC